VWQQNAAAWAERLGRQYPLYRDVVQPVQLAVQELRYGLALMQGAAAAAADSPGARLAPVLARLMAFPRAAAAAAPGLPPIQLDSPDVQQAAADAAATAAAEAAPSQAASAAGADAAEEGKRRSYAAAMSARLQLLRCSLAAAANDVQAALLGADGSSGGQACTASVAAAQARLHSIFMGELPGSFTGAAPAGGTALPCQPGPYTCQVACACSGCPVALSRVHAGCRPPSAEFVGAWEEVKAEEERRAAAEAELFRHKTRSTDIASEEQVGWFVCVWWRGGGQGNGIPAPLRTLAASPPSLIPFWG
jgi:midasin